MSLGATCTLCASLAPAWLWRHREGWLYLLPSLALAWPIRTLAARHPAFFILVLPGTLCHELAHYLVGALCGAAPAGLTIIPRPIPGNARGWELGSVLLTRVRWYNAAPAALAPLLLLGLPWLAVHARVHPGWHFGGVDLVLALLLAPQWLSCWPSRPDWAIAARSWPALLGAVLFGYALTRALPSIL